MFGWFKRKPKQVPASTPAPAPPAPIPPTPQYFGPNRVEEVVFSFDANYEQAQKYREALGQLDPSLARATVPVQPGDTLQFSYRIVIEYFGTVVRNLGIIQQIAEDPEMLVKVDIDELQHGRCVILDAIRALDEAIERIRRDGQQVEDEQP